jgi:hypothetical protein
MGILTGWHGPFYSPSSCVVWYEFIAIDFSVGLEPSAKTLPKKKSMAKHPVFSLDKWSIVESINRQFPS